MRIDNNTINALDRDLITITGVGGPVILTNTSVSNSNLFTSSALHLENNFAQIAISGFSGENLITHIDSSILKIDQATILQASDFSFNNLSSYNSDSSNNHMISIIAIDLAASFPSVIQDVSVQNSGIGLLQIQVFRNNYTENNMLAVQNVQISNCESQNKIDLITLTSLSTYDPYAIVFSNLIFENLNFQQGTNLISFSHLLSVPVQIINSTFRNISGAKISVESSTTEFANLYTPVQLQNLTGENIEAKFDSFIELSSGARLNILDSSFSDIN